MTHVIQEIHKCNWVLTIQKTVLLLISASVVPIKNELLTRLPVTNLMGNGRSVVVG